VAHVLFLSQCLFNYKQQFLKNCKMCIDVNNQQDATTFSFINLFKSALHVSGDKFAHPQEHFLTLYQYIRSKSATVEMEFKEFHLNHGIGRQQRRFIVPKAVYTVKTCS